MANEEGRTDPIEVDRVHQLQESQRIAKERAADRAAAEQENALPRKAPSPPGYAVIGDPDMHAKMSGLAAEASQYAWQRGKVDPEPWRHRTEEDKAGNSR